MNNSKLYLVIKRNVVFISLTSICFYYLFVDEGQRFNIYVLSTFFVICIVCAYKMFKKSSVPFSLNKSFYIFNFFFFGLAPAIQYKFNVTFWGVQTLSDNKYLLLNLVILMIIVLYELVYKYFYSKLNKNYPSFQKIQRTELEVNKALTLLISFSILSFLLVLYSRDFNLLALLIRGGVSFDNVIDSGPLRLIINNFVRPIPVISLLLLKIYYPKTWISQIFLLLIVLLSNAPTGMPRFQAAALYIPLMILYLKPLGKNINFSLILSFGIFSILPVLGLFRNFSGLNFQSNSFFSKDVMMTATFDSYHNFLVLLDERLITYGNQLLGVLFFYVPRSIWQDKPIGSGSLLAGENDFIFDNVSMNFFGEGYINFGYTGVVLFCIIFSYTTAKLDLLYYKIKDGEYTVVYMLLVGLVFFILRGDLLSSVAFSMGMIACALTLQRVILRKSKQ